MVRQGLFKVITRHEFFHAKFKCSLCPYSTNVKTNLKNHQLTHSGLRPFTCSTCGKCFSQKGNMKQHEITHIFNKFNFLSVIYGSMFSFSKPKKAKKVHLCPFCNYSTIYITSMKNHQKKHTVAFFVAPDENFSNYQRNISIKGADGKILNRKMHKCPYCNYSSMYTTHLKYHLSMHTGYRPYKCPHCSRGFISKSHMKKHMVAVHKNLFF
nr:oocyte zinc finger protein XlCOF6-like [Parasteatoda tepidariorum]